MCFKAGERRDEARITQGGEPSNADINADGSGHRGQGSIDLAPRLNRHEPLAGLLALILGF